MASKKILFKSCVSNFVGILLEKRYENKELILNFCVESLYNSIREILNSDIISEKKYYLLAEKAYHLIQSNRMADVSKEQLVESIRTISMADEHFNLYQFVKQF